MQGVKHDAVHLAKLLNEYIDNNKNPMLQEFCYLNKISRNALNVRSKDEPTLAEAIERCHTKQEIRTIKLAESGEINTTFAIFKLKQKCYGWSDKQEVDQTISNKDDKPFKVEIEVIK
jgi:hypothetical protein